MVLLERTKSDGDHGNHDGAPSKLLMAVYFRSDFPHPSWTPQYLRTRFELESVVVDRFTNGIFQSTPQYGSNIAPNETPQLTSTHGDLKIENIFDASEDLTRLVCWNFNQI